MPSFTNQATLTYQGQTVASNRVTGQVVSALTMTKTAVDPVYTAGDTVSYVISLVNNGSVSFENLTLNDDLGGDTAGETIVQPMSLVPDSVLYYINGVLQPKPEVTASPFTVTGIQVPAGGCAALIYEVMLTDYAPLAAGGQITNTARVTGPALSNPLTAQAVISAVEAAELSIAKSLFPAAVEENGVITYTLTIQNSGNTPALAADNVSVADQFDPVLSDLSVTIDGAPALPGLDYTYEAGLFSTAPGRITVPAAVFSQSVPDRRWRVEPGETVITVTGRL